MAALCLIFLCSSSNTNIYVNTTLNKVDDAPSYEAFNGRGAPSEGGEGRAPPGGEGRRLYGHDGASESVTPGFIHSPEVETDTRNICGVVSVGDGGVDVFVGKYTGAIRKNYVCTYVINI